MHIETIKIYGERASGTQFLVQLLRSNLECEVVADYQTHHHTIVAGWKHGEPDINLFKDNSKVLHIIIFRELESWLKSFHATSWHLYKIKDFQQFLIAGQQIFGGVYIRGTQQLINHFDQGHTIFEIRYHKFQKLAEFMNLIPHFIQINLDYLQANASHFIDLISIHLNIKKKPVFTPITTHTKTGALEINRIHSVVISDEIKQIIDSQKNIAYEELMRQPIIIKRDNVFIYQE